MTFRDSTTTIKELLDEYREKFPKIKDSQNICFETSNGRVLNPNFSVSAIAKRLNIANIDSLALFVSTAISSVTASSKLKKPKMVQEDDSDDDFY
jgi:uncharacterized protein YaaN involved in tellurite resistance